MSKNKTTSLVEKRWKESADTRTKKVVEKAALLIDSYYHLKKRSEEWDSASSITTAQKKSLEEKLTSLQAQLEIIEKEIQHWQGGFSGKPEQTLTIDQLTAMAPKAMLEKSSVGVAATVYKLKPRINMLDPIIELARKKAHDSQDYQSVWAELVRMAERTDRPTPLTGYTEQEGVLYQDEKNASKALTKSALAGRIRRKSR